MVDQKLNLNQSQSLVMTPQLQQAIKLLQLSNMELAEFLESEIEQNPLLEKGEGDSSLVEEAAAPDQTDQDHDYTENTDSYEHLEQSENMPNGDQPLDVTEEDYYSGDSVNIDGNAVDWGASTSSSSRAFDEDTRAFDENLTEDISLRDHLSQQIGVEIKDQADQFIAAFLVDCLDETGYMREETTQIAVQLNCPVDKVDAVLGAVQQFDPAGCFARDLKECLALQLKDQNRLDPAMEALLENLEMLASGKIPELCKLCGVDMQDLADMIAEIKALNPKPGDKFRSEQTETLIPDVIVKLRSDETWHVELNTNNLPKVLVNNRYYAQVKGQTKKMSSQDQKYLGECYQNANWLVKALHQRATTILKVASELVNQQDEFFRKGIEYLKPMTLKVIAEKIDMHESTVSRVTTNKYLATPRGIFEMKYFFTSAVGGSGDGDGQSSEFVRHKIKAIIENEPPKKPYSDDKLVKLLKDEGVDVARRTVAKYRELLGIPSSTVRKRKTF